MLLNQVLTVCLVPPALQRRMLEAVLWRGLCHRPAATAGTATEAGAGRPPAQGLLRPTPMKHSLIGGTTERERAKMVQLTPLTRTTSPLTRKTSLYRQFLLGWITERQLAKILILTPRTRKQQMKLLAWAARAAQAESAAERWEDPLLRQRSLLEVQRW
jgi:hypothetical protein